MKKKDFNKMWFDDATSFLWQRDNRYYDNDTDKMVYKKGDEVKLYKYFSGDSYNWKLVTRTRIQTQVNGTTYWAIKGKTFKGIILYRYHTQNGYFRNGHARVYIEELDKIVSVNIY